jgi:SAM-dependent methyltransferase
MTGPEQSPSPREIYEHRALAAIAARWDTKARAWDQQLENPACHLNEDDAYHRFLEQVGLVLEARRSFCAQQGMIDAGCGTGQVLAHVLSSFAWGIGVDISVEMIRVARAKLLAQGQFILGDCFELPAICPRAGAVLSRGVLLSHYGHQQGEALLRAARAALVPGGFVVFDFLNEPARTRFAHVPGNKTYFLPEEVCTMAHRAGFHQATVLGEPARRALLLLAAEG